MKSRKRTLTDSLTLYPTQNDLPLDQRTELNALMNLRLASAIDLQLQMKQAHWNVKGPSFIGLHKLFDEIDESIEEYVDMIAERIVQLGGIAEGTIRIAASRSRLDEYPADLSEGMAHVSAVATALAAFGKGSPLLRPCQPPPGCFNPRDEKRRPRFPLPPA